MVEVIKNTIVDYSTSNFLEEIYSSLKAYYIDYEVQDEDDAVIFSFKIKEEGMIAVGKNEKLVALTFENGEAFLSDYFDKKNADHSLFTINTILKHKIKESNYKGMH